jgi:hypothetical protein
MTKSPNSGYCEYRNKRYILNSEGGVAALVQ